MERNNPASNRDGGLLQRSESKSGVTTSSDLFLQWGNRKRLRCMKVQGKEHSNNEAAPRVNRTTTRVIRSDLNKDSANSNQQNNNKNVYLNLRQQRPSSPSHHHQRILRNSESSIGMRGQSNGGVRGVTSPDKKGTANNNSNHHHHHHNNNNYKNNDNHHGGVGGGDGGSTSSETAQDGKKGGSSGSDTMIPPSVWPPKFVIALTNKEKEEDFMAIKGSRLPQRPKKRAKFIQRTLNLVSPGAWLCDLTLERYEVREKKVTKKRPRGLKAMGNMESDSE
ncbi:homeobox protein 2-like [Olea europaea var. sylvestris]|uniref:homeobox protein 2-like n=1 Tax=Olea europaea var. sylvestris TaxID=158386 RepID=UPI000C1CE02A|nr:homeobox protein 2-like [Olea europaea var. sylvestris]XP_022872062.1 homeobox protein 2-like [Olea europaea var. sylvestris]